MPAILAKLLFSALLAPQALADIDVFMEKVLEKREVNWADYQNYFCNERAELSIDGELASVPIQSTAREFLWYVRDGLMVRSPIYVDGVAVSPEERERAELDWIERAKKRESRRSADRERFFGFAFEPGSYFYAGRRELEGREVVVVEHYPEKSFGDGDDEEDEKERELEAKLNKVLLVTLLIDPEEHQIVRMTLDNAGFDFLPAKWLVQIDTLEATMTISQPFAPVADVWLARDIRALGRITTAVGDLSLRYETSFYGCVKAETNTDFVFPRPPGDESKTEPTTKKKKKKSKKDS